MKNYFENPTTIAELKQQFRQLALLHHPDKGGDPEKFKEISLRTLSLIGLSILVSLQNKPIGI